MPTLYRQYRPQRFADVIGQSHITDTLIQAIKRQQLAHAYLFQGPRGTGKTTTARLLARRLNCTKAQATEAEPCNECPSCVAAVAGTNLDIIEIDAASNRGIDDIRALQEGIGLKPTAGKYKVYIIDEVHMLTREAFTALLKTLEEPVAHAVFILATTELHKVPETIISRSQLYRFRRGTNEELTQRLTGLLKKEKRKAAPEAVAYIIQHSDGCFRDAESLLGQALAAEAKTITVDTVTQLLGVPPQTQIDAFLLALVRGEAAPALAVTDAVFGGGYDPEQFILESIRHARTGAVALAKGEAPSSSFAQDAAAAARLPAIVRALIQAVQDLAYVPEPLIALQLAIVTLCTKQGAVKQQPPIIPTGAKLASQSIQPVVTIRQSTSMPVSPQLEEARAAWPKLIEAMRKTNPVAATFLRAMEPASVEGDILRVQASYSLHRNFFDKAENIQPLEKILNSLIPQPLKIQCFLNEEGSRPSTSSGQARSQSESNLLAAVKEVFG
jgi:DNA polymerase-3 subunit gamma/tau